jgi:hypothetical protein
LAARLPSWYNQQVKSRGLTVNRFGSFEEARAAERQYYRSLDGEERLAILFELIALYQEEVGEAEQGFTRVYRITQFESR